jgi:hypothetical protein
MRHGKAYVAFLSWRETNRQVICRATLSGQPGLSALPKFHAETSEQWDDECKISQIRHN